MNLDREQLLTPIATAREILGNNRRAAYVGVLVLVGLYATDNLPLGAIPSWWPVVLVLAIAAAVAGNWAAKRILDLLPEPEGILIVEMDATDTSGGAIYELDEEAFEELTVLGGDLYQWDGSSRRVYEVRSYDPDMNQAVCNWRESEPASTFAGERTVDDALAAIDELRSEFETDAQEARHLKRQIRGIVRSLDKERADAWESVLDDHVAPSMGDAPTVGEMIEDRMPDEIDVPTADERQTNGHAETDDGDDEDDRSDEPATMNPFASNGVKTDG